MRWSTLAGIGAGIAGVCILRKGIRNSQRLQITRETIEIPALPAAFEGFRLLHLTDLHLRRRTPVVDELLSIVEAIRPDLVCLTGDYAFTALSLDDVECFLRGLAALSPAVGVYGNADYRTGITDRERAQWAQIIPFLDNRALCLERSGEALWIAGVGDPHSGRDCLPEAVQMIPAQVPVILLAHSPEVILRPIDPRVCLILTGHTHGGQICLPGGIALYRNAAIPASFASGRHQFNDTTLYVSRGIGATRIPVRYGCLPEMTLFTLRSRV